MAKLVHNMSKKKGLKPGSIVFVGEKKIEKSRISIIDYDKTEFKRIEVDTIEETFAYKDTSSITWINIDGLQDVSLLEKIGNHFGISHLVLEDIANTGQRPKVDEYSDHIFIVLKMLYLKEKSSQILSEQFSFILGINYIITFQERIGDIFEPVRERLKKTTPRIRFMSTDYLTYTLIDAIVDNYYTVLEDISVKIEDLEDILIKSPTTEDLESIHTLKRQLIQIRKATWPLRESIGSLERLDSDLVGDHMKPYVRDLYEHVIQVIDTIETFREMVSGLLDIYLSSISNKMNEVMKVLTIIATIFIPLSFLAGVYGMNFDTSASPFNLPELGFPYGYLMFWGIVILVGGGLLIFFKKKKWI